MSDLASLLPEFESLLRQAGQLAIDERRNLVHELKPDGSIVTNADRAVENFLRKALTELIPGTTVWGEELGHEDAGDAGLWTVDPIDGTSNFNFGSPLWGVTAALVQGSSITLGGVFLPDLDEMVICARGDGVRLNGQLLPAIPSGSVKAHELVGCCDGTAKHVKTKIPGKLRCAGAFVIDGTFVASQRLRGMIGRGEKLYDAAACILFGEELGAEVRYLDGRPLDIPRLASGHRFEAAWIIFPPDCGFSCPD